MLSALTCSGKVKLRLNDEYENSFLVNLVVSSFDSVFFSALIDKIPFSTSTLKSVFSIRERLILH